MFNEKVSEFRRQLFNKTTDIVQRKAIKGTRWLLLAAKEKLEDKEEQAQRLKQALVINKPLATVYYMKEDLRQLWCWTGDKKAAEWHLRSWIIITDLFERLCSTIKRMSQAYVHCAKDFTRTHGKSLHNSYRLVMIKTISQRLDRLKQNTAPTDSRNAFGMTGTALMVIKDKAVDQRVNRLSRIKTTMSRASRVDGNAYQQGMTDGNKCLVQCKI